jgi:hypothetical protein
MRTPNQQTLALAQLCRRTAYRFRGNFAEYDVAAASRLWDGIIQFHRQFCVDHDEAGLFMAYVLYVIQAAVLRGCFEAEIMFRDDLARVRQALGTRLKEAGFRNHVGNGLSTRPDGKTGYQVALHW